MGVKKTGAVLCIGVGGKRLLHRKAKKILGWKAPTRYGDAAECSGRCDLNSIIKVVEEARLQGSNKIHKKTENVCSYGEEKKGDKKKAWQSRASKGVH